MQNLYESSISGVENEKEVNLIQDHGQTGGSVCKWTVATKTEQQ